MDNIQMSELLKEICKSKHITIKSLLETCDINRNFMYDLKNNKKPSIEALEKIADYLDCSVDYLLGRNERITNTDNKIDIFVNEDKKLIQKYHHLDNFGKEAVGSILEIEYKRCTANQNTEKLILSTVAARSENNSTKIHTRYVKDLSQFTPDDTDL